MVEKLLVANRGEIAIRIMRTAANHHHQDDFPAALKNAYRSLCEFQIDGVATNLSFLQSVLLDEQVTEVAFYTRFIDDNIERLLNSGAHQQHYLVSNREVRARQAGATVDSDDPLAVLNFGQQKDRQATITGTSGDQLDDSWILSPMQGTILEVCVKQGAEVIAGETLVIMDSMKMEHEIKAEYSGVVDDISVVVGDTLYERQPLLCLVAQEVKKVAADIEEEIGPSFQSYVSHRCKPFRAVFHHYPA